MKLLAINKILCVNERPLEFSSKGANTVVYSGYNEKLGMFRLVMTDPSDKWPKPAIIYVGSDFPEGVVESYGWTGRVKEGNWHLIDIVPSDQEYLPHLQTLVDELKIAYGDLKFKPILTKVNPYAHYSEWEETE